MDKVDPSSSIDLLAKKLNSVNRDLKKLSPQRILIIASLFLVIITVAFLIQRQQDIKKSAAVGEFLDTFSGNPAAPEPYTQLMQDTWDIQIHSRDPQFWYKMPPVNAHHGPNCQSPNDLTHNTHNTDVYEEMVFLCKDHMMTALNGGEYGMIYLTPNALVDFSQGEALIKWDMSTFRSSDRDWIDIWITPYDQNMTMPLEEWIPDAQGQPKNAIHIRMDGSGSAGPLDAAFKIFILKDGVEKFYVPLWRPYNKFLTPDKARRDTFELKISKNRIKLSMPGYNQILQESAIPELNWNQGVVQFGHHSYNPLKNIGVPGTWHWDNISIKPSIPFKMIKANKRYVDGNNQFIEFNEPAPENSFLRFSGIGKVEVSYNNGSNWQDAKRIDGNREHAPEHFSSYFTPIAQGTSKVHFRFSKDSWYGGNGMPYFAKDFAIWSQEASVGGEDPTPTPEEEEEEPTSAPTQVPTVPTSTPTNIPTATPSPAVTAQSTLALSPSSSNVTSGKDFSVQVRVNTNGQTINGTDLELTYPTNLLEVLGINDSNSNFEIKAEKNASNGVITLAYATNTPKSGNLLVATINLRAKGSGIANINFSNSSIVTSDLSNGNVVNTRTNGTYTISAPTNTPTPTPLPTKTPTPTPTVTPQKRGDMNLDGIVDIQDLSYLLSKWRTSDKTADINGDGRVNISDLSILLSNWTR